MRGQSAGFEEEGKGVGVGFGAGEEHVAVELDGEDWARAEGVGSG